MSTPAEGDAAPSRVAAFFDVDNTIIRGASSFHIARSMRQHGFFRRRDILKFGFEQVKYQLFGESDAQMEAVKRDAANIIRGWSVAEMAAIGEGVWDEVLAGRVYPGTKALIDGHVAKGHQVWLVTATPKEVGQIIAAKMGATGALGTVAEHENGYYTGVLAGGLMHGPRKVEALRELAQEVGIDLPASYAYGDSSNDIAMLESVGHPCAVNPDSKMRRAAEAHGWPVEEFRNRRKDGGRHGIVSASVTGTVWVILAVMRGIRAALCKPFRR